jgi:DNA mismatch endonuclease, patch repair protein
MADTISKEERSRIMARVRSRDNRSTELQLIALLRKGGITGWSRHAPITGKPDVVFREFRLAIFIDGCFWHGCSEHLRLPKTNSAYWRAKILKNMARDRDASKTLRNKGWVVLRIWEHELKTPIRAYRRILGAIDSCKERRTHKAVHRSKLSPNLTTNAKPCKTPSPPPTSKSTPSFTNFTASPKTKSKSSKGTPNLINTNLYF